MGNIIDNANAADPGMTVQQVALVVLIIGLACFITARWVIWRLTRNIQDPASYSKTVFDHQGKGWLIVPKTDAEIKADRKARRYRARYGMEPQRYVRALDDDIDETTALIARDMMDTDDGWTMNRRRGV